MGISKLLKTDFKLHKIRIRLSDSSRSYVGANKFKSIGWLPVSRRVDQIILNHVFKIKSGQSAHYIAENRIQASSVHSYLHIALGLGKVETYPFLK